MSAAIEVVERDFGNAIEIEERCSMLGMTKAFTRDYPRLMKYLEAKQVKPGGVPYARYLDINWEKETNRSGFMALLDVFTRRWHFQAGIPAAEQVEGAGEIHTYTPGRRRYVMSVHYGPYKRVGETYKAMIQWLKAQGLQAESEAIELYTNDPAEVAESEIETEVYIPVN